MKSSQLDLVSAQQVLAFQSLAGAMLKVHFGVDAAKASLCPEAATIAWIKDNVEPWQAVNDVAACNNLVRIDVKITCVAKAGGSGSESRFIPVTSWDESAAHGIMFGGWNSKFESREDSPAYADKAQLLRPVYEDYTPDESDNYMDNH